MKNFLKYLVISVITGLLIAGIAYAGSVFNSGQVGGSPGNGKVLQTNGTVSTWVATSTLGFAGGTVTTINNATGPVLTFATTTDTNLGLNILTSGSTATFTPTWIGTLAAGRLNGNVVQGVTNDTNVTGSITSQVLTLGWTGTLADSRIASAATWNAKQNALTFPLSVANGGTNTNTLASLTVGSNLSITGGQNVLIGTSTQISLGSNVVTTLATGTSGTIFNGSIAANTLTLNLPFASASNTGQLQAADWTTFNNKQPAGAYLTGNQTITLSGDVTGSGATAITTAYNNPVPVTKGGTGTTSIGNLTLTSSNLTFGSGDGKLILVGTSTNITLASSPSFTNGTFTGTLNVSATSTLATATVTNLIDSALTAGNCVQYSANGLTTTGSACGAGGGSGNSAWTIAPFSIYNATSTDAVVIGGTATSGKVTIIGTSDQNQLVIKTNVTQSASNPEILVQNNLGAERFRIHGTSDGSSLAVGAGAGNGISAASKNDTYLGANAGATNSLGTNNVGVGFNALTVHTGSASSFNTAVGSKSLAVDSTGAQNTAVGYQTLFANTTGISNTAIGYQSLLGMVSNTQNTAIGDSSGSTQTDGANNIFVGYNTSVASTTGSNQLSIGNWIYGTGGNIGIGTSTPGQALVVSGSTTITSLGAGCVNSTATGALYIAACASGGGSGNSAWTIGNALIYNATSTDSVIIGSSTPYGKLTVIGTSDQPQLVINANSTQSTSSPLILANASDGTELFSIHTPDKTSLGLGYQAGSYISTSNRNDTFIGYQAGLANTTGLKNIGIGPLALTGNVSGQSNLALGYISLRNLLSGNTNIAIGDSAASGQTAGSGNIFIGASTLVASSTGSNQLSIGNWIYGVNGGYIGVNSSTPVATFSVKGIAGSNNVLSISSSTDATLFTIAANGSTTISSLTAGTVYSTSGGSLYIGAAPVTNVTGSGNIASSGGTTPNITFTGVLPVANGGTATTSLGNLTLTSSNLSFGSGDGKLALVGTSTNITLAASPSFTNGTFTGTLSVTGVTTLATTTLSSTTVTSLTDSGLTSGNCVQASTNGLLTTTGSACGAGGSGNSAWTIGNALIYNATSTDAVLIGTSTPTTADLYVVGSGTKNPLTVASSSGSTLLQVTSNGNVNVATMTTGSILFAGASGLLNQNNSNLFWDSTNNRLGIGTSSPTELLHIAKAPGNFTTIRYDSGATQGYFFSYSGDNSVDVGSNSNAQLNLRVNNATVAWFPTAGGFQTQNPSGALTIVTNNAPAGNPQEATFTNMRPVTSTSTEFTDYTDEDYGIDKLSTINIAKSGSGKLRPFGIRFWNQDAGVIAAVGKWGLLIDPSGATAVGPAYSTSTYDKTVMLQVASSTAPIVLAVEAAVGTRLMVVKSNGNVGIGTNTPTSTLMVQGTSTQATTNIFTLATSTGASVVNVAATGDLTITGVATSSTAILVKNPSAQTVLQVDETATSSGITIGTTTTAALYNAAALVVQGNTSSTTLPLIIAATSTGAVLFQVNANGTVYASSTATSGSSQTGYWCYDASGQFIRDTAVCLVSARKFKKDIEPLNIGLSELMKLQPVQYYLKQPFGKEDSGQQIGLIADDVARIDNRLVTYDNNGDVHGFNYMQFTSWLTKAIQEQQVEIQNITVGKVKRSVEENWQDVLIGLLVLGFVYQQVQINKLKK